MARKFTKYPSSYVKASTNKSACLHDLAEHLDYMSDAEINALEVSTRWGEPEIWIEVPSYLESCAEDVLDEIPTENTNNALWYQIEYHPDDNSIVFGVSGDVNLETLYDISEDTKQRFIAKFQRDLGL